MSVRRLAARLARLFRPRRLPLRWLLPIVTGAIAAGTLLVLGTILLSLLDNALQQQLADYLRGQAVPVLERELGPRQSALPTPPTDLRTGVYR